MFFSIEDCKYEFRNVLFSDYAPSFEESDHALQQIIEKSKITDQLDLEDPKEDEFQLKPLYQILLNFIWISLKVFIIFVCSEYLNDLMHDHENSLL